MKRLGLVVYPLAQLLAFVGTLVAIERGASLAVVAALLFTTAALLSVALHISVHEEVHHNFLGLGRAGQTLHAALTLLLGLPFGGYAWQHFNHHKYENGPLDYSTTWRVTDAGLVPHRPLSYALAWPVLLGRSMRRMAAEHQAGTAPARWVAELAWQKPMVITFFLGLLVFDWRWGLSYALMVYLGWAFVSLHNYGQHPPVDPARPANTTSYTARWFNRLFYNNGLHWEHHHTAGVPHLELAPAAQSPRVNRPHFLAGAKVTPAPTAAASQLRST